MKYLGYDNILLHTCVCTKYAYTCGVFNITYLRKAVRLCMTADIFHFVRVIDLARLLDPQRVVDLSSRRTLR